MNSSSIDDTMVESKSALLEDESEHLLASSEDRDWAVKRKYRSSHYIAAILGLSNVILIAFMLTLQLHHKTIDKPWLPPEYKTTALFEYHGIFAQPPSPESDKAWEDLMPVGRGYVRIKNDTALPNLPGLDQSLTEQRAIIAAFHQIHCLYTIRDGYFGLREGIPDKVPPGHMLHCWDYLRQTIMCFADTTLEWLPAPPNDNGTTGWGYRHQCRDYKAIFLWAEENRFSINTGIQ